MQLIFQILAAVLIGIAAYYFYIDYSEAAFVSGVLAICSFFLSVRSRIKERMAGRETDDDEAGEMIDDGAEPTADARSSRETTRQR